MKLFRSARGLLARVDSLVKLVAKDETNSERRILALAIIADARTVPRKLGFPIASYPCGFR